MDIFLPPSVQLTVSKGDRTVAGETVIARWPATPPVKKATAKNAPAKKSPAKKAPAKKAPTKKAPAKKAPVTAKKASSA
jgi:hypothetical protein